jgi:hypothetical protein
MLDDRGSIPTLTLIQLVAILLTRDNYEYFTALSASESWLGGRGHSRSLMHIPGAQAQYLQGLGRGCNFSRKSAESFACLKLACDHVK